MNSSNPIPKRVYRYIPVHRLWQVLATKCLYFMRNSKWDDPFEGFLVKQCCETIGKQYMEVNSDKFFLCCSRDREKDHLWRNYTPNKDGVVVTINVEAVLSVNKLILCRPIKYPTRSKIDNLLKQLKKSKAYYPNVSLDLLFIKRLAFKDENEIRFLLQDATAKDDIVSVKIKTERVIESILFDPRKDHDTYAYHRKFIEDQFGISKITHSSLYDPGRTFKK
jgi:hypothetical protein